MAQCATSRLGRESVAARLRRAGFSAVGCLAVCSHAEFEQTEHHPAGDANDTLSYKKIHAFHAPGAEYSCAGSYFLHSKKCAWHFRKGAIVDTTRLPVLTLASRRAWLQGMLALAAVGAAGTADTLALAADQAAAPQAFMALSQVLTGKPQLDPALSARLFAALQKSTPGLPQRLAPLTQALAAGSLDAASQALALRILQGWYLGVVDGVVVSYEQALMFDAVADTVGIPTYCAGAPGFWAAKPAERAA